jgi:hypothetical protein
MTTTADYSEKIPNNVDLHEDRRLQRALGVLEVFPIRRLLGPEGHTSTKLESPTLHKKWSLSRRI